MERGEKQPEDLQRPDGNSLQANYQKHDVGEATLIERLNECGIGVTQWGIDMRDDDGEDGIIYDDKMDFKAVCDDAVVGLIDVKTKGSPRWMGRFNERHYVHYHGHAVASEVPVFVVMFQVDYETNAVYDEFVFEIDGNANLYERVHHSETTDAVRRFPDGNEAVLVPHEHRQQWTHMEDRLID